MSAWWWLTSIADGASTCASAFVECHEDAACRRRVEAVLADCRGLPPRPCDRRACLAAVRALYSPASPRSPAAPAVERIDALRFETIMLPTFILLIISFFYPGTWYSGRTSVSGRRTFPVLRSTCS